MKEIVLEDLKLSQTEKELSLLECMVLQKQQQIAKIKKNMNPPDPILVKSGETVVGEYNGNDYIFIPNHKTLEIGLKWDIVGFKKLIADGILIPLHQLKITDRIAKLRPIVNVIHKDDPTNLEDFRKLTYIDDKYLQCKGVTYLFPGYSVRLATVKDLTESSTQY